jgi:hypothetical protein
MPLAAAAKRPFERQMPGRTTGEPSASQRFDVGDAREVGIHDDRVETSSARFGVGNPLDRVRELTVATVKPGAGVPDVERSRSPPERSEEARESIRVQTERLTREGAFQLVSALEQVEGSAEVAVARERPFLVREEDFAHPREMHP